ncbi:MAG TPA: GldG family protein [Clostridiales bacterium]|nr:GldG family protein [Clostridiales bacterium]HPV01041.1 GldG family protein [Clostridiales bacterium]
MAKIDKNRIRKILNKKSLKYGTNAAIMTAAVIVMAIVLNLLIGLLDLKLDLTPNKLFSLSETTIDILNGLDKDVEIIGLFDDGSIASDSEYKQVTDLLSLYAKYPHITVRYVDPDKNPGIINQLDPDDSMDLGKTDFVVRSTVNGSEKKKKLEYYDLFEIKFNEYTFSRETTGSNAEQGFTGAIKYVTSEYTPVVYFTEGHDEYEVDYYFGNLKTYLERNNFLVKKINLLTVEKMPDDAELVIIASPKKDFSYAERDVLDNYFYNGGNAIFMFDYLENDPSFDELNGLLSKYNLAVNYDKVKETDENRHLAQDPYTLVVSVKSNSIIPRAFNTLLTDTRSLSILKNVKDYVTTTPLITTSPTAVGEMVNKSRGDDLTGPLDLAVAVEYKGGQKPSKIIAMGNSTFVSDSAYQVYGDLYFNNINFFLSAVNWMVEIKDDIIVPTKSYDMNRFNVTARQANVMSWILVAVFPLLILGTGLMVYLRRRHL